MARPIFQQMLDRPGMRIGKVENVDEVADPSRVS
jgi:hypothetical protein